MRAMPFAMCVCAGKKEPTTQQPNQIIETDRIHIDAREQTQHTYIKE